MKPRLKHILNTFICMYQDPSILQQSQSKVCCLWVFFPLFTTCLFGDITPGEESHLIPKDKQYPVRLVCEKMVSLGNLNSLFKVAYFRMCHSC